MKNYGFTLIEMLVAIAIISILTTIAIPQYTKYKKNAAITAAEAGIYNCINAAMVGFAAGEEQEEFSCKIGNEETKFSVNDEGIIEDKEEFIAPTIKGIKLTCALKDGIPLCKLATKE